MRLYKMELYKLCHRKIFVMGAILVIGFMLAAFCSYVVGEEVIVDGTIYRGYRAVQMNRRITSEFKGVLTDEKVEKIVEKYVLPHNYVGNGGGISFHENFLSDFVNDYAYSDLDAVREITGQEIILEYYEGWNIFLEIMSVGMILGSIWVLFSISAIFANEGQTNMLQLIFTTKEGREKEVYAKIAAAMTVAVSIWAVIFFLDLLLCGIVYGLDGLNCYNGMVMSYLLPQPDRMIPMSSYIMEVIMLSFFGIVSLCTITICVSADIRNNLHALSVAAICYVAPFMVAMFTDGFDGAAKILCIAPIFMVIHYVIEYIYNIWILILVISILISIICTIRAYRKYSRQQVA